jgi:hypothetical protein
MKSFQISLKIYFLFAQKQYLFQQNHHTTKTKKHSSQQPKLKILNQQAILNEFKRFGKIR